MLQRNLWQKSPSTPGVYFFKGSSNRTLYVGKAKNLRERLSYYFQREILDPKTAQLVLRAQKLEWLETVSEADALILESELIKKLKPFYNRFLKDDKSYQYIKIGFEKSPPLPKKLLASGQKGLKINDFPRVFLVRKRENAGGDYFGPYPVGSAINQVLKFLRKIYGFRDCSEVKFQKYQKLGHGCLFFDLKLCPAPCAQVISRQSYRRNLAAIKSFLTWGSEKIESRLTTQMGQAARRLNFEKAALYKQKLEFLARLRQTKFTPADYLQNPLLARQSHEAELRDLVQRYNKEASPQISFNEGFRIEAYDASHLKGQNPVASLVSFVGGQPDKEGYRRFKVKKVKGINDYAMIAEVLARRFGHPEWLAPQMILIDGGLGQVRAAEEVVKRFGVIPVLGLAKRRERPVFNGRYLYWPKTTPALNLLRRVRDESHRFAKAYHHLLRSKEIEAEF